MSGIRSIRIKNATEAKINFESRPSHMTVGELKKAYISAVFVKGHLHPQHSFQCIIESKSGEFIETPTDDKRLDSWSHNPNLVVSLHVNPWALYYSLAETCSEEISIFNVLGRNIFLQELCRFKELPPVLWPIVVAYLEYSKLDQAILNLAIINRQILPCNKHIYFLLAKLDWDPREDTPLRRSIISHFYNLLYDSENRELRISYMMNDKEIEHQLNVALQLKIFLHFELFIIDLWQLVETGDLDSKITLSIIRDYYLHFNELFRTNFSTTLCNTMKYVIDQLVNWKSVISKIRPDISLSTLFNKDAWSAKHKYARFEFSFNEKTSRFFNLIISDIITASFCFLPEESQQFIRLFLDVLKKLSFESIGKFGLIFVKYTSAAMNSDFYHIIAEDFHKQGEIYQSFSQKEIDYRNRIARFIGIKTKPSTEPMPPASTSSTSLMNFRRI